MWLCILTWSQAGHLMRHLKTHSGEKSNKCNLCYHASFQASDLRMHLKTHVEEKSNKCNLCDYASSQAGSLRRHLKTHSEEKPNKCNPAKLHIKIVPKKVSISKNYVGFSWKLMDFLWKFCHQIYLTVPILPPSPKFLTRLIHALFACASSDVSQKELQSSTQQKKVQSDIKSAKVVPKKSTYSASYSQISNEGNSGVYLGTTLVPNLDDFLGGKLEKGFSPQCIFKLLLKWP